VSVVQARHATERADVAIVVLDAGEGVREMDATIAGYAHEAGRGIVLAVNKWDLAPERGYTVRKFEEEVRDRLKFLHYAPVVFLSARTGKGLGGLLKTTERVQKARETRVTTGELNRLLARASQAFAPKADKGNRQVKILFGTQVGTAPPTFVISISHPVDLHFSYRRYLENQLREAFGFAGTPIVLKVRTRKH